MINRFFPCRFSPKLAAALLVTVSGVGLCARSSGAPPPRAHAAEEQTTAETDRTSLLHKLIAQRAELARANKTDALQQCDAQIRNRPVPPGSDAAALTRRLAGTWRSPRHDYLYRTDGSWTMLPAEQDAPHGDWRVVGNQLEIASNDAGQRSKDHYTIILIGDEDLVYADRETVFFEKRLKQTRQAHGHAAAVNR